MPNSLVCTRAIQGGSFSSEPGPTRFPKVPDHNNPAPSHQINRTTFIEEVVEKPQAHKCQDTVVLVQEFKVTQFDLICQGRQILAIVTRPNYIDTEPFPTPAAKWKYRATYTHDAQSIGQWSNAAEISVGG